jgi:hypothetical protein
MSLQQQECSMLTVACTFNGRASLKEDVNYLQKLLSYPLLNVCLLLAILQIILMIHIGVVIV